MHFTTEPSLQLSTQLLTPVGAHRDKMTLYVGGHTDSIGTTCMAQKQFIPKIRRVTGQIYQGKLEPCKLMGTLKYFEEKGTQELPNIPDYREGASPSLEPMKRRTSNTVKAAPLVHTRVCLAVLIVPEPRHGYCLVKSSPPHAPTHPPGPTVCSFDHSFALSFLSPAHIAAA